MTESAVVSLGTDLVRFAEKNRLTAREHEILGLLVRGHDSVPRIAETLNLSRNTIHNHFKNIFRRTRCNSKTGLLAKFISGVAARRARPAVAAPRVLLLQPRKEYQSLLVDSLSRLGMQVYVEAVAARVLDRVRDLHIHAVVTDGVRETVESAGPVALLAEIYGDHPAIFYAMPPAGLDDSRVISSRAYELPHDFDAMAIAIYRHCNNASYGLARSRRESASISVCLDGTRHATASNLSTGGAFIELPGLDGLLVPPSPGTSLQLELALCGGQTLPVRAEVVWTRQGAAPGVGVRFMELTQRDVELLRETLAGDPMCVAS